MGTLNSIGLWGALAAAGIAIPIIIHLLHRKHRKQTDWAAMELLRRALVVRAGQVKLEDYLVLFLRCLALLLLALALLRPTFDSGPDAWLGERSVGLVVGIDASFSMNHGEPSRFERALGAGREILATAREGDPLSVVLMSSRPEVLVRGAAYAPAQLATALDAVPIARPYPLGLAHNLELLEELVDELKTPGKECYLITDAQEQDWAELPEPARNALARLTEKARVFIIPTPTESTENLAVEALTFSSGSLRPGQIATFTAQIRNHGLQPASNASVEFLLNDRLHRKQSLAPLAPGERRELFFNATPREAGPLRITARLSPDQLADDNDRYAVVDIPNRLSVLAVGPPASGDSAGGEDSTFFAATALRPRELGTAGEITVTRIQSPDLPLESLQDYDLVLLADVPAPAPESVDRLTTFVERGGGLLIFMGPNVEPELFTQRFGIAPDGLLPATLGPAVRPPDPEVGWPLAAVQSEHPLSAMVRRLPSAMLDEARVHAALGALPAPGSEILLTLPEPAAPLLLTSRRGSGAVVLCTTSADLEWSDLPQSSLFVALLHQVVSSLSNNPDALLLTAGETVPIPLPGREAGRMVSLTPPSGTPRDLRITQTGPLPSALVDVDAPGIYQLGGDPQSGSDAVVVAANPDPRESYIDPVDSAALRTQLDPLGVTLLSPQAQLGAEINKQRRGRELAPLLLALAIAVFIAQSLLARRVTKKNNQREIPDLAATLQRSQVAAARRS